jgi:hypothetical protein
VLELSKRPSQLIFAITLNLLTRCALGSVPLRPLALNTYDRFGFVEATTNLRLRFVLRLWPLAGSLALHEA